MRVSLLSPKKNEPAFTLVEIVMAIGIFAFALIGVVMLLGNALHSSSETQKDSALSSAVTMASAWVRGAPTNSVSTNLYFNQMGVVVTNASDGHFQFALRSVGTEAGVGPANLDYWTAVVTAPHPATNVVGRFLLSRTLP